MTIKVPATSGKTGAKPKRTSMRCGGASKLIALFTTFLLATSMLVASEAVLQPSDASAYCLGFGYDYDYYHYQDGAYRGREAPYTNQCNEDGLYKTRSFDYSTTDGCFKVQASSPSTVWQTISYGCGNWTPYSTIDADNFPNSNSAWDIRTCWISSYGENCHAEKSIHVA